MHRISTDNPSVQVERMEARIAELDAVHTIETRRLGALLATARNKLHISAAKRGK